MQANSSSYFYPRDLFWLKRFDFTLLLYVTVLVAIGLLEIFSSSRGNLLNFQKQLIFFIVGVILMFIFSLFDWRFLKENPWPILFLYFLSFIFLALLFLFSFSIKGRRGWYRLGIFSFDPAELMKISLLILLSRYFSLRHAQMYQLRHIFISGFYVILPSILVFLQPDFAFFIIFLSLWLAVLLFSGVKIKHFLFLLTSGVLLFSIGFTYFLKPYQKERILAFLFPEFSDPLKIGWSQRQAKIALGSGGLWGKGIKNGSQVQLGFLPEPETDFIFSAIGEEMGFVGISILFIFYFLLLRSILKIGLSAQSNFVKLFCGGLSTIFCAQIILHVGTNVGILPVVGIYLPFVSYGGSSLLSNFILLGIVQSIKLHA